MSEQEEKPKLERFLTKSGKAAAAAATGNAKAPPPDHRPKPAPASQQTKRKRRADEFVMMPVRLIRDLVVDLDMQAMGVCTAIIQEAWKAGGLGKPFSLSNEKLAAYGVTSRDVKRRILDEMEDSGYIVVERNGNHAPVVTWIRLPTEEAGKP